MVDGYAGIPAIFGAIKGMQDADVFKRKMQDKYVWKYLSDHLTRKFVKYLRTSSIELCLTNNRLTSRCLHPKYAEIHQDIKLHNNYVTLRNRTNLFL